MPLPQVPRDKVCQGGSTRCIPERFQNFCFLGGPWCELIQNHRTTCWMTVNVPERRSYCVQEMTLFASLGKIGLISQRHLTYTSCIRYKHIYIWSNYCIFLIKCLYYQESSEIVLHPLRKSPVLRSAIGAWIPQHITGPMEYVYL